MLLFLLPLFALALIMLPFFVMLKRRKEGKPLKTRKAILINAGSFIGVMVMMSVFVPLFAFASAEGAAEAAQTALSVGDGLKYLGAALATGLATIGTGIAVGGAAPQLSELPQKTTRTSRRLLSSLHSAKVSLSTDF